MTVFCVIPLMTAFNLKTTQPRRVLAIRLQALGDTIITLPYLNSLRRQYPDLVLHFLTRKEVATIPSKLALFDRVISLGGGRNVKLQAVLVCLLLPWLWFQGYDAVIDLQNNKLTRLIRRLLFVRRVSEFDNCSLVPAGERTRRTIEEIFGQKISLDTSLRLRGQRQGPSLLHVHGWNHHDGLVVLNPAGFFPSRNWPAERYIEFSKLWMDKVDPGTKFVLLLLPSKKQVASVIATALGKSCFDLTGLADQAVAFEIVGMSTLVLSEDSGLMHMAWVQGVPTLALFSSSRAAWSAPIGRQSLCLDSSDLACGPCMKELCQYGDNRCLTRYSSSFVLDKAIELLKRDPA